MIRAVAQVALLVRDSDEAKKFYCGILGFKLVADEPMPSGKRWVVVKAPEGAELILSWVEGAEQEAHVGKQAGGRVFLFLHTDDLAQDYLKLSRAGVHFTETLRSEEYGKVAVFEDLYGNRIDLIEPAKS